MAGGRRVTVMVIKMVRRSFENVELANKSGRTPGRSRPGAGREPDGKFRTPTRVKKGRKKPSC